MGGTRRFQMGRLTVAVLAAVVGLAAAALVLPFKAPARPFGGRHRPPLPFAVFLAVSGSLILLADRRGMIRAPFRESSVLGLNEPSRGTEDDSRGR